MGYYEDRDVEQWTRIHERGMIQTGAKIEGVRKSLRLVSDPYAKSVLERELRKLMSEHSEHTKNYQGFKSLSDKGTKYVSYDFEV